MVGDERDVVVSRQGRNDQSGFILVYVLGVVLMLSIMGLAIMRLTVTSGRVSGGLAETSARLRAADTGLERASADLRMNEDLVGVGRDCATTLLGSYPSPDNVPGLLKYSIPGSTDEMLVRCVEVPQTPASVRGSQRVMNLSAARRNSGGLERPAGVARIKVVDEVNGSIIPGYSIEVCDWQLGAETSNVLGCA